ncbi:zinc finger BED domain-containing protein DAYSLEEPER-like [Alnus glutinosa]|uniref:zinc finger BED domain-containing protein DAYSLEEPER-like n=1 Tax=Alnus glutinosa TaxID=3517 RepID=UPI002D79F75B|nr:zinc finger BED domain-containing protein DAYSLEEPER-like [Alnus glutinosa]
MEDRSRPMEVNEVVLVNEVDLGDDTTTHSITLGAAGSGNAPDQSVTVDTPHFDPPTVRTTSPTVSHTVGSVPTPGDVSTSTSVFEKKQRQKTSKVWDDFSQVEVLGVKKSQCNWCKRLFAVSKSSSTSTLGRHLVACVKYVESNSKKQKVLTRDRGELGGGASLTNFSFSEKRVRELAVHMVLFHEYPFNMMEHELFNKFMKVCTPHWKKISRATLKSDCITIYLSEKKKIKAMLGGIEKVNITTDIGVVIADALRKCFIECGIEDKVLTITVDNARANDSAIRIIKDDFELRNELDVGGRLFHVRCCAHVTNLLVQARLAEIGDIVDSVRQGIKYVVASEGRLKEFSEIAKRLHLPSKKLVLDVPSYTLEHSKKCSQDITKLIKHFSGL